MTPAKSAALFSALLCLAPLRAADAPAADANRVVELTFTARKHHDNPFNTIDVDVTFTAPDGKAVTVPAFWDGGDVWRVRYASPQVGVHSYRSQCSDPTDDGLHGREGVVQIRPYDGDNSLYKHGPIRIADDHRHFAHADGTSFFWLGDTWWMGLCERLRWPNDFKTLAADRRDKGFTVIQIVAGLYPDMPAFDERGRNEAGFPWEKDYSRIRPEYFDKADERLFYLADQGLVPCIVGAWGYHLPWMGVEKMKRHWRYLVARYGALPVVWCVAGEINLPYYLDKGFPRGGEKQTADWEEVIRYVRKINAFGRPVTVHPTGLPPLSGRALYKDQELLDFDMLQTGHGGKEVLAPSIRTLRASYEAQPTAPVVNGEVCYEGLLDRIPAEVPRLMFWASILSGAAGHTYGANGIWQVNRKEQPYGKSPHGGDYGHLPWDEAMKLPGSEQLGKAKRLLEEYPWQRFTPYPEWAAWEKGAGAAVAWGDWIWYPEGDPTKDAPVAARYFRRTFELPEGKTVVRAVLHLTVDDKFTAYLNGELLGSHADWMTGRQFDAARLLRPGKNVLAVRGENAPGPKDANPAGLSCDLEIVLSGDAKTSIRSDGEWRCARDEADGWRNLDFDDRDWAKAKVAAKFGEGPWGRTLTAPAPDEFMTPYAAGVPGMVRIIYLPQARAATVRNLEQDVPYTASTFDPTTGRRDEIGPARPNADGSWTASPPAGAQGDWVLILQVKP
ncbi:MAG TPA: DUF4038 domain-containing protein [Gemmataceae bacterium]|nr:DUF4038 domain-containing protein [Gemmataceae bacterium]